MKCPHCSQNIDVQFIKAPANMQGPPQTAAAPSDDLGEILAAINDRSLTGKAVGFVADMRDRFSKYGGSTRTTEKQIGWLKTLAYGEQEDEWL